MVINKWHPKTRALSGGKRVSKRRSAADDLETHWIEIDAATFALLEEKAERSKTTVPDLVGRAIDDVLAGKDAS